MSLKIHFSAPLRSSRANVGGNGDNRHISCHRYNGGGGPEKPPGNALNLGILAPEKDCPAPKNPSFFQEAIIFDPPAPLPRPPSSERHQVGSGGAAGYQITLPPLRTGTWGGAGGGIHGSFEPSPFCRMGYGGKAGGNEISRVIGERRRSSCLDRKMCSCYYFGRKQPGSMVRACVCEVDIGSSGNSWPATVRKAGGLRLNFFCVCLLTSPP